MSTRKGHLIPNRVTTFVLRNWSCSTHSTQKTLQSYDPVSASTQPKLPNTFHWNMVIKANIDAGLFNTALSSFSAMRDADIRPDHFTFPLINRAISFISNCGYLGEAIHCLGLQMGFLSDVYFSNTLVEMYLRCDHMRSARNFFDEMHYKDVVSWTSMISGYVRVEDNYESFLLFRKMQIEGIEPNSVTLAVVLRACAIEKDVVGGRQLHGLAIKRGLESHELVQNSILTVLCKADCLEVANRLFTWIERSVVSWNIMMAGSLLAGDMSKVVDFFTDMKAESDPSHETLTLVISAFSKSGDLLKGQMVHSYAVKSGQLDEVLCSSLIDFYAKCGDPASSIQLFNEIDGRTSTTWSVMMWGLIHVGKFREAIDLFHRMQVEGFYPIGDILLGLLLSYSNLGALQLGKGVHGLLIRNGFCTDSNKEALETSVLNFYVKCGSIDLARKCFDQIVNKDIIAWSSMVEGFAIHGLGSEALKHFYRMQEDGIEPNHVTFLSLLSACSHSGLVVEGCEVFDSMKSRFGIKPGLSHYTCMVDLLGRSGMLHEALGVIQEMTVDPDARIWGSLLASCRIHSDDELGALAARRLFDLEPGNVGYHVVLSNISASDNRWDEAESIRKIMGEKDLKKHPGWSCVEVRGEAHLFVAGDTSHFQVGDIYELLGCLTRVFKVTG